MLQSLDMTWNESLVIPAPLALREARTVVVVKAKQQELNCPRRAPGYFTLIGDKAPPAARDSSVVARA